MILTVSGDIDLGTRREFEVSLHDALGSVQPPQSLVVDLDEVTFLGSAGLALLLSAQETAVAQGTPLRVVATGRAVCRPVEAVGLTDVLPLFETVESALMGGVPAPRTGQEFLDFTREVDSAVH